MPRWLFFSRCKKKEWHFTCLKTDIEDIIKEDTQIDPQLRTERCYVRITAKHIRKELVLKKGFDLCSFSERTINNVLNRLGYYLKKVLKTKPLKKIPETDAIFENVAQKHTLAHDNPRILRISIDTKAKVKIGNLSRNGYSRNLNAPKTDDHDQKWEAVLVPFGIKEFNTDDLYIIFGNSKETSNFILDALELWWSLRQFNPNDYDLLMIDLDNGKPAASNTKLFLKRIVAFAQKIDLPIQLVYYPPYHSKYNAIERVWAALEKYWKPLVLDTIDNTLAIAEKMTFKGINPIVKFIDKVYQTGIEVPYKEFKELQDFVIRNPNLRLWDVLINPTSSA